MPETEVHIAEMKQAYGDEDREGYSFGMHPLKDSHAGLKAATDPSEAE